MQFAIPFRFVAIAGLAVGLAAPAATHAQRPANALSPSDEDFITQFYQEVVVGQRLATLAVNEAKHSDVRSVALNAGASLRHIRHDVRALAKRKDVTISKELEAPNQDVIDKLSNADGDDFDKTYLGILLKYLPKILNRCEDVASTTQDKALQAFATRTVPYLQERIDAVKAVKARRQGRQF